MTVADARAVRVRRPSRLGEHSVTRRLHRLFFATVSALPRPAASWVRTRIFNRLFESGSPWPYSSCSYEGIKRDRLMAEIPAGARVVIEIGCADGHNLEAAALRVPDARIIGVDISDRACSLARQRVSSYTNVDVIQGECADLVAGHPALRGTVDAVVVSEVLYYLGTGQAFADQVAPLRELMSADGVVIAVHTCADAGALHARLADALGLHQVREETVSVADRAFTLAVLSR